MRPSKKSDKPLKPFRSDTVWAVISILSLPTIALSLAGMGWKPYTAFLMACLAMLGILLAEGLTRGKIWIFQDSFRHIFEHQDTPFRILVVTGGILLLLETFLLLQLFQNPSMDGFLLNIIAKKQCVNPKTAVSSLVCPMLNKQAMMPREDRVAKYSLEEAAKKHLLPDSLASSCIVMPISQASTTSAGTARFFAHCQSWEAGSCAQGKVASAIVTAEMTRNEQGYLVPMTWQEDRESDELKSYVGKVDFVSYLDRQLDSRCSSMLKGETF